MSNQTVQPIVCQRHSCERCLEEAGCFWCYVTERCYHDRWLKENPATIHVPEGCNSIFDQAREVCVRTETIILMLIGGIIGTVIVISIVSGIVFVCKKLCCGKRVYSIRSRRHDAHYISAGPSRFARMAYNIRSFVSGIPTSPTSQVSSDAFRRHSPPHRRYPQTVRVEIPVAQPRPTYSTATTATAKDVDTFSVFASPR